jgi:hypothetical protein
MQMTKVSQKAKPKRRRLAGFLAELEDDAQVVPILLGSFMKIPLPTLDWVERKLHIVIAYSIRALAVNGIRWSMAWRIFAVRGEKGMKSVFTSPARLSLE